jgi:arylformamidase
MHVYASFDQANLDREYSPSSLVEDRAIYLEQYARLSQAARDAAMRDETCELDLQFGPGQEETLDLFMPAEAERAPLQMFIHGGFWQLLSKNESSFAAPMFQEHGSFFAALNYTLAPEQSLTGIVEETRRSISWLYQNADRWGFDRDRIYLSGHSAGAHLAMMMLVTNWEDRGLPKDLVKGVCAVGGVFDLEPVRLSYVNDVVGMDADEARLNSPILHDIRNSCPVIFAYGDNETEEFKRQTDDYFDKLKETNTGVTLREIPNRNHFDVILDLADADSWLSQQVLRQMNLVR